MTTQACQCGWREGDSHPSWHEHCEYRREPKKMVVPNQIDDEYEYSQRIQSELVRFRREIDNGKDVFGTGEIDVILEALGERGASISDVRDFFRKSNRNQDEKKSDGYHFSKVLSPEDLPF